jgi:hypothetical protein
MAVLEQCQRLVVSEHSNIGRRVALARARRAATAFTARRRSSSGNGDDNGEVIGGNGKGGVSDNEAEAEAEAFTIRYLYSMDVRQLISATVDLGEWEMAVKRNDEAAVALRDAALTDAAVCAMPKDREATARPLPTSQHWIFLKPTGYYYQREVWDPRFSPLRLPFYLSPFGSLSLSKGRPPATGSQRARARRAAQTAAPVRPQPQAERRQQYL